MAGRRLTPRALARQVAIGEVALAPDGSTVVYTRRSIVAGRDRIDLWTVPWDGGAARQLTDGPSLDVAPVVSPGGDRVAYLSTVKDAPAQAYVVPLASGRARRVTRLPHGASALAWAPGGDALVVLAGDARSPWLVGERRSATPTARVLRRIGWREDGVGLLLHPAHLHVVPLDGGRPRRLTAGPWSAARPALSADGRHVLFLADLRDDADLWPLPQVHRVPLAGGEPEQVSHVPGGVDRFAVQADGSIQCVGQLAAAFRDHHPSRVLALAPDGAPLDVAPALDRWAGVSGTDTDLHDWLTDRRDAQDVWNVADRGRVIPHRFGPDGATPLVAAALDPVASSLAQAGPRVAAVMTLGSAPCGPDVYALEGAGPRRLTHDGDWLRDFARATVAERAAPGPGGAVQAFVVSPPGAGDGPLPTVLLPHGGPVGQWCIQPTIEALLLAAAGVRVVLPNPRGSYSHGAAWQAPLADAWGEVDVQDCHAVLDDLVAAGLADPERLGATGLSYGGFLVNWLVGTSDRFRAAVSENGVANNVAAWANSDCGPTYSVQADLGDPTTAAGVERLWRMSPLRHVARIETPLLLLQGEADMRCPAADAEQLFTALRWLRREVEYVLYPDESHIYQGDGRFDRRVDRHERALAWLVPRLTA